MMSAQTLWPQALFGPSSSSVTSFISYWPASSRWSDLSVLATWASAFPAIRSPTAGADAEPRHHPCAGGFRMRKLNM